MSALPGLKELDLGGNQFSQGSVLPQGLVLDRCVYVVDFESCCPAYSLAAYTFLGPVSSTGQHLFLQLSWNQQQMLVGGTVPCMCFCT